MTTEDRSSGGGQSSEIMEMPLEVQEVTARLPGRVDPGHTSFRSAHDLADAMIRASVAHGQHEKRIGKADPDWPAWYAKYMVAEQTGTELPQ
jgi:hypothetical protein